MLRIFNFLPGLGITLKHYWKQALPFQHGVLLQCTTDDCKDMRTCSPTSCWQIRLEGCWLC